MVTPRQEISDILNLYSRYEWMKNMNRETNDVCRDGAYFATVGNLDPKCLASRISKIFSCYDYYIRYGGVKLDSDLEPKSVLDKNKPVRTDETDQEWDFKMLHWTLDEIERLQYREYARRVFSLWSRKSTLKNLNLKKIQCIRLLCKQLKQAGKYFMTSRTNTFLKVVLDESKNVITVNKKLDNDKVFPLEKNKYVEKVKAEFVDAIKPYSDFYTYSCCRDDVLGLLENKVPDELVRMIEGYIIG